MSVAPLIPEPVEQADDVRVLASSSSASRLSIGIVVPVLNEAAILERALVRLKQVAAGCPVVVVDGGSTDGSAEIARRHFPTVVCPAANRGAQMNLGARTLSADVLLFLHTDSALPDDFSAHIRRALADPRVVAGCFRLRFDSTRAMLRLYSWCTQFPGRFLHFGDQAFFFRRDAFEKLGGYRELLFMEDVDILRRLRAPGFLGLGRKLGKFVVLPASVTTSARRFLQTGVVRQQLVNILIVTLFELGVSARRLARLYPHIR
jgi:rSAM/selenodomain-associated transferase 2